MQQCCSCSIGKGTMVVAVCFSCKPVVQLYDNDVSLLFFLPLVMSSHLISNDVMSHIISCQPYSLFFLIWRITSRRSVHGWVKQGLHMDPPLECIWMLWTIYTSYWKERSTSASYLQRSHYS